VKKCAAFFSTVGWQPEHCRYADDVHSDIDQDRVEDGAALWRIHRLILQLVRKCGLG